MEVIIFFGIGLIIGSFLNVLVYRLRVVDTILGRSHCPKCGASIGWRDNIPLISFVLLRGKCRNCQDKISWQYPLMEFITGVIFALTYLLFAHNSIFAWVNIVYYLIIFSGLIVLSVYDWQYLEVPTIVFYYLIITVGIYLFLITYNELSLGITGFDLSIWQNILGGFLAWIFFFSLVFFSKEKWMGWGDVYIGFLSGTLLGWHLLYFGLTISFAFGAFYAIVLMLFKNKGLKSQVPFVPFLVIGTIVSILLQQSYPGIVKYLLF